MPDLHSPFQKPIVTQKFLCPEPSRMGCPVFHRPDIGAGEENEGLGMWSFLSNLRVGHSGVRVCNFSCRGRGNFTLTH
jgi:hypothetical protein